MLNEYSINLNEYRKSESINMFKKKFKYELKVKWIAKHLISK